MRTSRTRPKDQTPTLSPLVPATEAAAGRTHSTRRVSKVEPRLLRREDAATYLGVSPSYFDTLSASRRIPGPKQIGSVKAWDRFQLDAAIDDLPIDGGVNAPSDWD